MATTRRAAESFGNRRSSAQLSVPRIFAAGVRLLVPAAAVLFANQCVAVAVHLLRRETNVSLPLNILWFALIVYLLWYGTHRPATIQRADEPMEMPLCER
jgi:hypothetical protein